VRLAALPGAPHLGYCTNIHAGESWDEVHDVVRTKVSAVKARVSPDAPLGVGLRLSARAAETLEAPAELARFQETLAARGLYVFSINGFPYGAFHGTRVKENVYRPDWAEPMRAEYTIRLARILAALLPDSVRAGSVSTVPLGFRAEGVAGARGAAMADALRRVARELAALADQTGKRVVVALEPEPACALETTPGAVRFFEEQLFAGAAGREACVRAHVGVCLDACHAAVEFEDAKEAVAELEGAGIAIAKLQLTSAIEARGPEARARLGRFAEDTYLHQCVVRHADGSLSRHLDLPEALGQAFREDDVLRTHFHVPIFLERLGVLNGTQGFLRDLLALVRARAVSEHLEVETYTWDVLPAEHRQPSVIDDVARELTWAREVLA
jgi:sugar phosphate isomerase/epimerase